MQPGAGSLSLPGHAPRCHCCVWECGGSPCVLMIKLAVPSLLHGDGDQEVRASVPWFTPLACGRPREAPGRPLTVTC